MAKKVIAVIFGGCGSYREESFASAAALLPSLSEDKYFVIPVYITNDGKWLLYDGVIENINNIQWEKFGTNVVLSHDKSHGGLLRFIGERYKSISIDIVMPLLPNGSGLAEGISGLCRLAGLPFAGCRISSSAVCADRAFSRIIADSFKIEQVKYITAYAAEVVKSNATAKKAASQLKYPCMVKTASDTVTASNKKELTAALEKAAENNGRLLIEKFTEGRTLVCSVIGDCELVSGVGELVPFTVESDENNVNADSQSIKDPNADKYKTVIPADLPVEVINKVRLLTENVYKAFGCRITATVKFILTENANKDNSQNRILFDEIDTTFDFSPTSVYGLLWSEKGFGVSELANKLISLTLERSGGMELCVNKD